MHWLGSAFSGGEMGDPDAVDYVFYCPDYVEQNPEGADVWGHDLAFNPGNGDLYVVFTDNSGIAGPGKLYYFRIEQPDPDEFEWVRYGDPWLAYHPGLAMNCWLPSVDVGVLDVGSGPEWCVGVAFTARYHSYCDSDFSVAGNWWPADEDGNHIDILLNSYVCGLGDLDAGLPSLDIAHFQPGATPEPFWAIAYMQKVPQVRLYDVYLIDSLHMTATRVQQDDEDNLQKILPSIACHIQSWDHEVSISMYERQSDMQGTFKPLAARYDLDILGAGQQGWYAVEQGCGVINGPWAPLNVAYADVGVATEIVIQTGNYYYMGFANSVTANPTAVYAAWGNTYQ